MQEAGGVGRHHADSLAPRIAFSPSKAGMMAKKERSPISMAVRTGCFTCPVEKATSADRIASIMR
jgi:hypothetical protein